MLVNAADMLNKAVAHHYAIGAFNENNLEWTRAILKAAEELQTPLIIQCSMGAAKYQTGYKTVSAMVHAMVDACDITVPVALHLDHGSYDACIACIEAGFTSVMYDGSHEDNFEINLAATEKLVKFAHSEGISVEAEVGGIGGVEDGMLCKGECADPKECRRMAEVGIDFLACGIGNIHGLYPDNWEGLQFDVLGAIKEEVGDLPLVLHGGTGIPMDQIKKAISMGVAKININTDLQVAFNEGTREYYDTNKDRAPKGFDPRKSLKPGAEMIVQRAKELIQEFGSAGKGWD